MFGSAGIPEHHPPLPAPCHLQGTLRRCREKLHPPAPTYFFPSREEFLPAPSVLVFTPVLRLNYHQWLLRGSKCRCVCKGAISPSSPLSAAWADGARRWRLSLLLTCREAFCDGLCLPLALFSGSRMRTPPTHTLPSQLPRAGHHIPGITSLTVTISSLVPKCVMGAEKGRLSLWVCCIFGCLNIFDMY